MHKVFTLYKEGKIKPVIDSVFTFDDVFKRKKKCFDLEFLFLIFLGE